MSCYHILSGPKPLKTILALSTVFVTTPLSIRVSSIRYVYLIRFNAAAQRNRNNETHLTERAGVVVAIKVQNENKRDAKDKQTRRGAERLLYCMI